MDEGEEVEPAPSTAWLKRRRKKTKCARLFFLNFEHANEAMLVSKFRIDLSVRSIWLRLFLFAELLVDKDGVWGPC